MPLKTGLYIGIEGGDGSGKGTIQRALNKALEGLGYCVKSIAEPGSGRLGPAIYKILMENKLDPTVQLFLFLASRKIIITEEIEPALRDGCIVLADRTYYSSLTYQGFGSGMDLSTIKAMCNKATGPTIPNLMILMDIDPKIGLARVGKRGEEKTSFEQEKLAYHERVREGYRNIAQKDPARWLVINATLPPDKVLEIALDRIKKLVCERENLLRGHKRT